MKEKFKDIFVIALAAVTALVCLVVLFTEFPSHRDLEALVTAEPAATAEPEPTPEPTAAPESTPEATPVPTANPNEELSRSLLADMDTVDKVWQLFIAAPESIADVDTVTATGDLMREGLSSRPVGGLLYTAANTDSSSQIEEMLDGLRELADTPLFIAYDCSAGTSAVKLDGNMAALGFNLLLDNDREEDVLYALRYEVGTDLSVADILTISADFLDASQIDGEEDSEDDGDEDESRGTPCCLSADYIRSAVESVGWNGLIATAPLRSVEGWSDGELAVGALLAGCDIILAPGDIDDAAGAVLDALNCGELPQSRLNDAVQKILFAKLEAGLFNADAEAEASPVEAAADEQESRE